MLNSLITELDSLIPILLQEHAVPGLAIGIVSQGQCSFCQGYGLADRERGELVTRQTLFNLASLSKTVTAWGILRLVGAGSITLDAPVNHYLRRWRLPQSAFGSKGVTVRRLLSHTAGISVPTVPWFPANAALPSLDQMLQGEVGRLGPVIIADKPGRRWTYSGGGYAILQRLMEDVTGESFETAMQQTVLEPLGMQGASFTPAAVSGPGVAIPYNTTGDPVAPYRLVGQAAASLYSSAESFARLLAAYVDSGCGLISQSLFETMLTPVAPIKIEGVALDGAMYGLGHIVYHTGSGEKLVYHSGNNPGYRAYFLVAPKVGAGLVLAANSDNADPVIVRILQRWAEHLGRDLPPFFQMGDKTSS